MGQLCDRRGRECGEDWSVTDGPDWKHLGPLLKNPDAIYRSISQQLLNEFGEDYSETFSGGGCIGAEGRNRDARFLFACLINPAASTGFVRTRDTKILDKLRSHILKLQTDYQKLSVGAKVALHNATSEIPELAEHGIFDSAILSDLAIAVASSQKVVEQRPKLGRTDKDWRQIIVAHRCSQIWENQRNSSPSIDVVNPEVTPFGGFVDEIFSILNINDRGVRQAFRGLKKAMSVLPDASSDFLPHMANFHDSSE